MNEVSEDHSSNARQAHQCQVLNGNECNEYVGDYFVNDDTSLSPILNRNCARTETKERNSSTELNVEDANSKLSNYVYQILNSTYDGEFLLACYKFEENEENCAKLLETKKTTYFSKWKVAKLVVNHEFQRTNSFTITPDRFDVLALEASKLFPSYFKETFYTRSSKNKSARGVFQSYYANQREKEITIGRLIVSRKRKNPEEFEESPLSKGLKDLQIPVQIIDEDYKQKWASTALEERVSFYQINDLPHIFETFPNLANATGYSLVQVDFENFFKKSSDVFEKNWSDVATKIIKFAKKKKSTDDCLKEILNKNSDIKNEEHRQTLALILLPFLFRKITKQTVRSKTKSTWNPEKKEVLNTFIFHIESTENFNDLLKNATKELVDMHNAHKIQLQPFVVINGPTLSNISSAYVIFDKYKYQVSTTTSAVNLCFQCMKVLHEKYSSVCNHVWQFLESEVYEMNIENVYSSVVSLKENLKKC